MNLDQPNFQSLRKIRDNVLLLSVANEYIGEDVFLVKIGKEIKKCLSILKDDIIALKKQFPGKFTQEVNTEGIMSSFESTAEEMLSGTDEVKNSCTTGKLGTALNSDVNKITEAIEKIWHQVKGSDIKYTTTDSIGTFFSRLNIFSGISRLFSSIARILILIIIIFAAGFSYLFFTMEKEDPILKENKELMTFIEDKNVLLKELVKQRADVQEELKKYTKSKLLRTETIAKIELMNSISEFNEKIITLEGEIAGRSQIVEENNKKLEVIRKKSFLDKLLKQ